MNEPPKKSPALALALGFTPAALLLGIISLSGQSGPHSNVLWPAFGLSVVCCFTSSFMLFWRKTGWAIACGLLLLLLNAGISLFTGCMALLSGMKF